VIEDVEQIRKNAQKYNDETSIIYKNAVKLARMFKTRLQSTFCFSHTNYYLAFPSNMKFPLPTDPTLPLAKTERGRKSTKLDNDSDEDEYQDQVDDEEEEDDDFVVDDPDDRPYL